MQTDLGDGIVLFTADEWRDPNNKWHQPQTGAMAPRAETDVVEFIVHHTGTGVDSSLRRDTPVEYIGSICEFHRTGRRYSDIAYHSAVISDYDGPYDGQVFELRDNAMVGGHTLASPPDGINHNRRGHGVVIIHLQPDDRLSDGARLGLRKIFGLVTIAAGWRWPTRHVHKDFAPTGCPNQEIVDFVRSADGLIVPAPAPNNPLVDPVAAIAALDPAERAAFDAWVAAVAAQRPSYPGKMLQEGSRGPLVRQWQEQLRTLGYGVVADSIFGFKTRRATQRFQQNRGLSPDGIVGPKTWAAAFS